MSLGKKILIGLVVVIAIPLIAALFVKGEYHVERQITLSIPKTEVFGYIKYLKNQNDFSKWATMDPDMKKTFTGEDGTVGFVSRWESENDDVGVGEQEILKISEGERIDFELRFIKPFESTEAAYMITEAVDANTTLVKWGFEGKMAYPMNLMFLFMDFDKLIGDDLQTGLENLKALMEK